MNPQPECLFPCLDKVFSDIPTDWQSFIIVNADGTLSINSESDDFSEWVPHIQYAVLPSYSLLLLTLDVYNSLN